MPVTITIPELTLPDAFPLLTAVQKRWDQDELARLGEQLAGVRLEDEGLWHTGRSDRHLLEVYAASRSFRLTRHDGDNELDGAADVGVGPDKASQIAEDFLAPFRPNGGDLVVRSIEDSIVQVSRGPEERPEQYVITTDVLHDIVRSDIAFVGPGAKARVSVRPDGEVSTAYLMWRDVEEVGELRARTVDEIAAAFGRARTFRDLTDDTARVEIVSARSGQYALPPTEIQDVFHPAVELRGTVTTESANLGFCTWVSAVEPRRLAKARRAGRAEVPAVLVA